MIADLITECTPVKGKKLIKKSRLIYQQQNIRKSVSNMLNHIKEYIWEIQPIVTSLSVEMEKALIKKLTELSSEAAKPETKLKVSERGGKNIYFSMF
ncbi:MAG: hypothetical protein GY757_51360 [bacterium]|nr:hypothetical protein [bacterium]